MDQARRRRRIYRDWYADIVGQVLDHWTDLQLRGLHR